MTLAPTPSTIANLPLAVTPMDGTELVPISQGGVTKHVASAGFTITGAQGPPGATGPAGATGAQGPAGSPGAGNINIGTAGQLAFYATTGQGLSPATVGSGLQLVGTTLSTTSGGSGVTFLGKVTASNSATIDLTSLMSASYNQYLILLENVFPITATANLLMRVSLDNSTFISTASYAWVESSTNIGSTATTTSKNASDTSIQIFPNQAVYGAGTNAGINGEMFFFNANDAISHIPLTYKAIGTDNTSGLLTVLQGGAAYSSNGPIEALRFLMSSGNVDRGTFYMYGLAKS